MAYLLNLLDIDNVIVDAKLGELLGVFIGMKLEQQLYLFEVIADGIVGIATYQH